MLKGVHLTLLVGPRVPVPAPRHVVDALTAVEITTKTREASGFQLTFALARRSTLNTLFLLAGGSPISILRVIVVVTVSGTPNVLVDGVVTHHQVTPGQAAGTSTLTVTGEDLTRVMDYQPLDGFPFPAMPLAARVGAILAKYATWGIVPLVLPSLFANVPNPLERIPRQQGTDLGYLRQMADQAGYVFYITPGPAPGVNTAYWGPEVKVGAPQPALNLDMDAHTNADSMNFRFDGEQKTQPVVYIHEPLTKAAIPIPLPDIGPLNPPLGLIAPIAKRFEAVEGTSKLSFAEALLKGLASSSRSTNAVSATGSLDVLRYGRVLEARKLVGVRGAGEAFDGLYYVDSVTHSIKRGQYKQNFTLSRNALVSTLARVPV